MQVININDLNQNYLIDINAYTRNRSRNSDFFTSIEGFITEEGQQLFIHPITVHNGEILHIQMDAPNSPNIDYDMYLFEVDSSGYMRLVDISEYTTYINGNHGTLSEAVGIVNTSGTTKNYAVFFVSYRGASSTMPFVAHIGINSSRDAFETDERVSRALGFNLPTSIGTISMRSIDTRADNDWFRFVVPENRGYNSINFTLDNASIAAGHGLELYTFENNQARRVNISNAGNAHVTAGTYFLRVTANQGQLIGTNYTIRIELNFNSADSIKITGLEGGTPNVTYQFGPRYRAYGNKDLTINGTATQFGVAAANTEILVQVVNPAWINTQ